MQPVLIGVIVAIGMYIVLIAVLPKALFVTTSGHTKQVMTRLSKAPVGAGVPPEPMPEDDDEPDSSLLARAFLTLPGAKSALPAIQKAGLHKSIGVFFLSCLLIFIIMVQFTAARFGVLSILIAAGGTFFLGRWFVKRRSKKQLDAFLESFPEALEMITRSVRAGYPLNAALTVVAENMDGPLGDEFKRLVNETSYGWTLSDALGRMCKRIDSSDLEFFSVVLNVQQETGGNLAEILENLANVIRKRRQMRMKIHALSSEGRATAIVLGSLPFFVMGLLSFVSPGYLTPLFNTSMGHSILMGMACVMLVGILIIREIINVEI